MAPMAPMASRILHVPFMFQCAKSRPQNARERHESMVQQLDQSTSASASHYIETHAYLQRN
ncbi:hypothetical protein E4U43_005964 [Claviceps pusilla]|uniref:Uncharacterized protein n=1 Tax=Claviceps pusilla TaxID=123648 RepID=A0A9P7N3T5_9HYPO|nr:hypothetical protein E4U43_005964 [Claviceps pusilla]